MKLTKLLAIILALMFAVLFPSCIFEEVESITTESIQPETTAKPVPTTSVPKETEIKIPDFSVPNNPDDLGTFENTDAVFDYLERNPNTKSYKKVTIKNALVKRFEGDIIQIYTAPSKHGTTDDYIQYMSFKRSFKDREHPDGNFLVKMRDDTKNRVLTGDLINITGILVVHQGRHYLIDCTYEMVTANWFKTY